MSTSYEWVVWEHDVKCIAFPASLCCAPLRCGVYSQVTQLLKLEWLWWCGVFRIGVWLYCLTPSHCHPHSDYWLFACLSLSFLPFFLYFIISPYSHDPSLPLLLTLLPSFPPHLKRIECTHSKHNGKYSLHRHAHLHSTWIHITTPVNQPRAHWQLCSPPTLVGRLCINVLHSSKILEVM